MIVNQDLRKFLNSKQEITSRDLDACLNISQEQEYMKSYYNFFTIKYDDNKIQDDDFIKFLENHIVKYVSTYRDRDLRKKDILKISKKKFVKHRIKSGEAGELILFIILESRGIVQLINKMNFKMATEKNTNGADAIHIQIKNDKIFLHIGESKMYQNSKDGTEDALKDIEKYFTEGIAMDDDLTFVSSNIDQQKFDKYADTISTWISPYGGKSMYDHNYINDVFVGYREAIIQDHIDKQKIEQILKIKLPKLYVKIKNETNTNIAKYGNSDRDYTFYFLSLNDIDEFSRKFNVMIKND